MHMRCKHLRWTDQKCELKTFRYILAVGTGEWDGQVANPSNPQRRDVQIMPAGGYLVRILELPLFFFPPRQIPPICLRDSTTNWWGFRLFSGIRPTPEFGRFIAISLGICPQASISTYLRALMTSKTSRSHLQLTRIVGIGRLSRGRVLFLRSIQGCSVVNMPSERLDELVSVPISGFSYILRP